MSFPLGSMRGEGAAAAPLSVPRWRQQALLLAGAIAWLLFVIAMATHQASDAAFTTSGNGDPVANKVGVLGARVSDMALFLFGWSAWWLVPVGLRAWLAALALALRRNQPAPPATEAAPAHPRWLFWAGLAALLAASCALEWTRLYRWDAGLPGHAGGVLGYTLGPLSMRWLGFAGSGVLWIAMLVVGSALALRFSWLHCADWIGERLDRLRVIHHDKREAEEDRRLGELAAREREQVVEEQRHEVQEHVPVVIAPTPPLDLPPSPRVAKERQKPLFAELVDTKLPQVDLLDAAAVNRPESVTPESIEMTSRLIEKKLKDFGVEVHVVAASPGPVITRYEIEPATGVKGAQVVNLARDLARSLSLVSIRVVEVIPGKNYMALELPNARRQTIKLSEILGSEVYNDSASMLTMGLGKDIVGKPVVADLAKMPHCLVAGTTGSGKSVGINAMILSLLYKAEARDVRLILIDPKMLEMSVYEGIPHLLAPVVTDMKQAANALNWCVGEMERRYKLMSKLGVRNLAGYNKKIDEAAERGARLPNPFSLTPQAPEPLERLPHVVVVIDELADLMMVVGKKIEELIARLAQKARAAGIHVILATQRPSVDVITGMIKANFPTRIAFRVAQRVDSRTILDAQGAEYLLGKGDMLVSLNGGNGLKRIQCPFVSEDEVQHVTDFLRAQGEPEFDHSILENRDEDGDEDGEQEALSPKDQELYDRAVELVRE
ncbi:MAG: DNA translocase FtsK 4TM domain-containing protein, partial [Burkholderiales bacterium]|nr:DNA translocase FtsK 4TM domain-containing protein [Burkholderiales bacterium]